MHLCFNNLEVAVALSAFTEWGPVPYEPSQIQDKSMFGPSMLPLSLSKTWHGSPVPLARGTDRLSLNTHTWVLHVLTLAP